MVVVIGRSKIDFNYPRKFRAIIGSRNASPELLKVAFDFARQSVQRGYIVVSGLARGIDTAAHQGALSVEGDFVKTVAVLSTSPDERIYPPENEQLAYQIRFYGATIHPFITRAKWERGVRFGQPQKRLVERDVLQAAISNEIYVVADGFVDGGSRWVVNYGKCFGVPVYRLGSERVIYSSFDYKVEPQLILWGMELDWEQALRSLRDGSYDFRQVLG